MEIEDDGSEVDVRFELTDFGAESAAEAKKRRYLAQKAAATTQQNEKGLNFDLSTISQAELEFKTSLRKPSLSDNVKE